jgi:hypothetical protein
MSELDYWSFVTNGGAVSLSVTAPSYGNLHPKFALVDSLGNSVVGWQDPDAASVSWSGTLAAGSYRLVVASHGPSRLSSATSYGFDVGSYSISGTLASPTNSVAAPTNLTATAVSSSQINLLWTDHATNATSYSVERSTDGTTWNQVASPGPTSTSYADVGLTTGVTYSYRVQAFAGTTASAYSNQASATPTQPVPAAPSNLVATQVSTKSIGLTWTDNATNETGFAIERATSGKTGTLGSWTQIATVGVSAGTSGVVSFMDTTVSSRKTYAYRVRAYNASGYSAYTNTTPPLAGGPTLDAAASASRGGGHRTSDAFLSASMPLGTVLAGSSELAAASSMKFWLAPLPIHDGPNASPPAQPACLLGLTVGDPRTTLLGVGSSALPTGRTTGHEPRSSPGSLNDPGTDWLEHLPA